LNLAIVIGVENYISDKYYSLPACKNDANIIKDVIEDVKEIKEVLFFNNSESAIEITRGISAFVEKYKDEEIDELFFYFSGHGERDIQETDRDINDFLYILHNFDVKKKRTTSLSNSELDNWVKTLSPKLFVKVVDACFSGTQYIKSEINEKLDFEKSAKKHGLNDIHFWFSSRENQKSLADENLSKFTESILLAISEFSGDTRYREIKNFIADDFDGKQMSKPYFVDQSNNTEKFGNITDNTHQIVNKIFGLDDISVNFKKNKKIEEKELNIFDLAIKKSDKLCFSEETLVKFMENFNKSMSSWDDDFKKIYKIEITSDDKKNVPNRSEIGEWLKQNRSANYFAEPSYDEQEYEVQEYIKVPWKSKNNVSTRNSIVGSIAMESFFGRNENKEYKLETVTKRRKYIDGFYYTHSIKNTITHISFIPKIEIVDAISLYIVSIYSNKSMIMHIAYETLKRNNWENFSSPKCRSWKEVRVDINADKSAKNISIQIQKELKKWLVGILKGEEGLTSGLNILSKQLTSGLKAG